jgi:hypothetical protein
MTSKPPIIAAPEPPLVDGSSGSGAALAPFVSKFLVRGGPKTPTGRGRALLLMRRVDYCLPQ